MNTPALPVTYLPTNQFDCVCKLCGYGSWSCSARDQVCLKLSTPGCLRFGSGPIIGGRCHKYHFVATNTKRFVARSLLLTRQTRLCRDKTRLLSRQRYDCRDRTFVATKIILSQQKFCRGEHSFVATKDVLWYLWQLPAMIRAMLRVRLSLLLSCSVTVRLLSCSVTVCLKSSESLSESCQTHHKNFSSFFFIFSPSFLCISYCCWIHSLLEMVTECSRIGPVYRLLL